MEGSPKEEPPEASAREQRMQAMDLFYAAAEGVPDKVEALLEARVDPNFRDYEQRTALHVAAGSGRSLNVIESLLTHRAEVNALDRWGYSPLDQSQRMNNAKVETLLKKHGAKLQMAQVQRKAMNEKLEIARSDVSLGDELGRTLKSVVHRATWNGVDVVAKFCITDSQDGMSKEEVEAEMVHEIELLASLRHPDLVMFLGCCLRDSPIMFITEYMPGGDLEHYYEKKADDAGTTWHAGVATVGRWGRDVLRALAFLHGCAQPIIHRDLKPMNLLLTQDKYSIKVTDFGISKAVKRQLPTTPMATPDKPYTAADSAASRERENALAPDRLGVPKSVDSGEIKRNVTRNSTTYQMTGGVGSWRYMAPEVARHEKYTEKVDIFAWALILYFMSCGRQPFHTYRDPVNILREYSQGLEPRPKPGDCPARFRNIMQLGWHEDMGQRPKASELYEQMVEVCDDSKACACNAM